MIYYVYRRTVVMEGYEVEADSKEKAVEIVNNHGVEWYDGLDETIEYDPATVENVRTKPSFFEED